MRNKIRCRKVIFQKIISNLRYLNKEQKYTLTLLIMILKIAQKDNDNNAIKKIHCQINEIISEAKSIQAEKKKTSQDNVRRNSHTKLFNNIINIIPILDDDSRDELYFLISILSAVQREDNEEEAKKFFEEELKKVIEKVRFKYRKRLVKIKKIK